MNKLTQAQQKALEQIIDYIEFAKKFNNFRDYQIASNLKGSENRFDYSKLLEYYTKQYDNDAKHYEETYKPYWINALNNIALTIHVSSSTLKALEKLGYIKIINDGGSYTDTIKLLKIKG